MIDCTLGDAFGVLSFNSRLEYCSAVWCSAADTHLKPPGRVVSGVSLLTGGMFECNISHRRFVAVIFMLNKVRCFPKHAVFWSHIGIIMRLLAAEPRSTA